MKTFILEIAENDLSAELKDIHGRVIFFFWRVKEGWAMDIDNHPDPFSAHKPLRILRHQTDVRILSDRFVRLMNGLPTASPTPTPMEIRITTRI